jgi:drug/metabolite transporter (DMT)-like permease
VTWIAGVVERLLPFLLYDKVSFIIMKKERGERMGEIIILSQAVIWALFPVFTKLSFASFSPILSLAWTTLFSAFFFLAVAIYRKSWTNFFKKELLLSLLWASLIIGVLLYFLYFIGLKYTSAGNAGIIATFEILFTFLFFNVWRGEFLDKKHLLGAILMFASVVIILSPNFSSLHAGDLLILMGFIMAPLANHFQKKLRQHIASEQILLFRTVIATPVLFLLAYFIEGNLALPAKINWPAFLLNALILFGLTKLLWVEAIHRISVTKAISLSSISPIFTLLFAFLILKDYPTTIQLVSLPLALAGVYFLTRPSGQA